MSEITKIKPLHDRVLIERVEAAKKSPGGVMLPDSSAEKPAEGLVVAAGPGLTKEDGTTRTLSVKEGDRVIFARNAGHELKFDNKSYIMMREVDIHAIISVE